MPPQNPTQANTQPPVISTQTPPQTSGQPVNPAETLVQSQVGEQATGVVAAPSAVAKESVSAPDLTSAATHSQTISAEAQAEEDLKKQAIMAMEGEEGRRTRELEEQRRKEQEIRAKLEFDKAQYENKLREIMKQKEILELEWIKYNNQKTPLETQLQPVVTEEKSAEDEERKTEQDEAVAVSTPGVPVAKIEELELKRWTIQERRHHTEEQKWAFQKQIETLKSSMDTLGAEYRKILNDEDALNKSVRDAEMALKSLALPKA